MISRDNASLIAIAATLAFPSAASFAAGQGATNTDLPPQQVPAQDPDDIDVVAGSSTMISLPSRIERVVVSDPAIADARPVSAQEVVLLGRSPGTADIVFRLENGQTVTRHLQVGLDEDQLSDRLRQFFGVDLEARNVGGTVVLRGVMPNIGTAERVRAYMQSTNMKWIDVTKIAGVQQVQLRVRIAEASRTALRELAVGGVIGGNTVFGGFQPPGGTPFQQVGISPSNGSPVNDPNFEFDKFPVAGTSTLFMGITGADLEIFLHALSENRYVRLLAEPNLVAISGESATFLVGGEFPIPVVQGSVVGGGSTVTVLYKEFGIRLNFRPEVLGDGKIRLEVAPEVSELSEIGKVNVNGFSIPGLSTRRSSTTVELASGQSFATAGLLRSLDQATVSRVPVLGDMPILGPLFRSVRYEQAQTELVVMVTAEVVEPLYDGMDRPMPGDLYETPNDWELFVKGQISGAVPVGSPVARLKNLGLEGLRGPGAWRRPDATRVAAADPVPSADSANTPTAAPTAAAEATKP
jgi:pilus assembly protein CpaC